MTEGTSRRRKRGTALARLRRELDRVDSELDHARTRAEVSRLSGISKDLKAALKWTSEIIRPSAILR